MVAAKGQVKKGINRVIEDAQPQRTAASRNFKVYSDKENSKTDAITTKSARDVLVPARLSVPVNKRALLASTSDSKESLKIMGNIKGKSDSPGKSDQNVRRKALADLSNFQRSFSRNVACHGSKPMVTAGSRSTSINFSPRKSLGQVRANVSPNVGDQMRKDLRAKNPGCESTDNNSRRNGRTSIVAIRKSVPVLKMNQSDTTNAKENDESSEKAKKTSGIPVKVKVSKKVLPQISIGRDRLWRNRVSDGFIIMAPREQTNAGGHVSSRKTVRTMVKTAVNASNVHRTSRHQCMPTVNKLTHVAMSSKKKEAGLTRSHLKNVFVVASREATQEEPSSDSNSKPSTSKLDAISHRNSARRRSFTSLLMARSKLLEEHGEATEQEKLPSIDDTLNQLEVTEYVDEIYQYYWVSEAQNLPMVNYMSIQPDITPQMRGILINWLIEVHFKFELMQETLYLMVTLLDRYLSQVQIKKNELQLVGLTALLLASKYEDFWHPRIKDLISISAEAYTRNQMLLTERLFLKKLKFRLNEPTPYVLMLRFIKAAQSDLKLEHLAFYLIELCLVEYEALKFKPSMLCASAIYVARSTLKISPSWTPLLAKHARYEVSQIRDCAETILRFHKAASTAQLKVTYEKYIKPDYSGVALIEPLDELPL